MTGKPIIAVRVLPCLAALFIVGCAPQQVQVAGQTLADAPKPQEYSRILVVGISHDVNGRCEFEAFLTSQLRTSGTQAKSSCSLVKVSEPISVESIDAAVAEYGADAVLATILVDSQSGAMVGGKNDTRGGLDFKATGTGYSRYYGGFGRYGVPVVYGQFVEAPVVTTLTGEATIRTVLYATSSEAPVYELTTTANDLSNLDSALSIIVPPITEQLQRAGYISR